MKKNIILFGALAMLAMASCNNSNDNPKEPAATPPPATTPPPAEKPAAPVADPQKDGTTINVNDQGVSVESKDGSKKSNVKISKDTTNIQISRPK